MTTLILAAVIAGQPDRPATLIDPVFLDKLSLAEARKLDGLRVYVIFTIDTPPTEYATTTITGPISADPRIERAVFFPTRMARRLEQQNGERVRVYGVVRVIDYPAAKLSGVDVEQWSAIRIEESSLAR